MTRLDQSCSLALKYTSWTPTGSAYVALTQALLNENDIVFTVGCIQMGSVFAEISSLKALTLHRGMKTKP